MSEKIKNDYIEDSQDQIQSCLNCQFDECIGRMDYDFKPTVVDFDKVEELKRGRRRLSNADRDVLNAYLSSNSDKEISDKTGRRLTTITEVRKRLGLPKSRGVLPEVKRRLVAIWLNS